MSLCKASGAHCVCQPSTGCFCPDVVSALRKMSVEALAMNQAAMARVMAFAADEIEFFHGLPETKAAAARLAQSENDHA